ncbi:MAG: RNA 3'-terminal phosphate cyclase [Nitrospirota bacterium]
MTIKIDGSYGEGGGQILRTSLSLSCVTKRPIEIYNIRKGRKKPGLQPQHLTCVKAAQAISDAEVQGAELQSQNLIFIPQKIKSGDYLFDVGEIKGSAGSVSLVLQTVLLPLLYADAPSTVTIIGGTHVPWSPPFHYLKDVFGAAIAKMGFNIELDIERWGWYPIGGGRIRAVINPAKAFHGLNIVERGRLTAVKGISAVSNLPLSIAERQRDKGISLLNKKGIEAEIDIINAPSVGKGTFFFLLAEFENSIVGFSSLGAIGKRAEEVAEEACKEFFDFIEAKGAVDPHLADQLILYMSVGKGESSFTTSRITQHLLTNIWVIKQFMPVEIKIEEMDGAGRVWCCSK